MFTKTLLINACLNVNFLLYYFLCDLVIYSPELQTGKIIEVPADPDIDREILSKLRVAVRYQNTVKEEIDKLLS